MRHPFDSPPSPRIIPNAELPGNTRRPFKMQIRSTAIGVHSVDLDLVTANVNSVAIYMTIASVITLVAVVLAKETANTSLRHDRVLDDATALKGHLAEELADRLPGGGPVRRLATGRARTSPRRGIHGPEDRPRLRSGPAHPLRRLRARRGRVRFAPDRQAVSR